MKFKQGSDFYKVLAIFSQAGCPFTQAGSLAPHTHVHTHVAHPLSASSAAASGGADKQTGMPVRSLPSTADSNQRTLVSSHVASIPSSSRPSTSSSTAYRSDSRPPGYSALAHDTSRGLPHSENPQISPFSPNSTALPAIPHTSVHQRDTSRPASLVVSKNHFFPSSSDPIGAATNTAFSGAEDASEPVSFTTGRRPWTAPAFESQSLSQMLPPKRELPFKASSTTSENRRKSPGNSQASSDVLASNSVDSMSVESMRAATQTKRPADNQPSDNQKNAPKIRTTKAMRATRSATAASRSGKTSSQLPDESPVPSVEEFLRRSQRVSERQAGVSSGSRDDGEASMNTLCLGTRRAIRPEGDLPDDEARKIDTQALLARVDERQRLREPNRKNTTKLQGDMDFLPHAERIASDRHSSVAPSPSHGIEFQTSAGESQRALSRSLESGSTGYSAIPAVPRLGDANNTHPCVCQEEDEMLRTAPKAVQQMPRRKPDRGSSNSPERPALADITNIRQSDRSHAGISVSLRALMNDPDFAESPEIAQWANLPREERDAALETWMCQQFENESFAALLKTMEGMWQRIFLGR